MFSRVTTVTFATKPPRRGGDGCHAMSCFAASRPFPSASPKLRRPYPAHRSSFRFRSVCAAAGLPAAGPFSARIAHGRAPVGAGAVRAPDCARARGQAQGARLPSIPLGFFAPARGGKRSGLRMPLPPVSFYHSFSEVKLLSGIISKIYEQTTIPEWLPASHICRRWLSIACPLSVAPDPDPGPAPVLAAASAVRPPLHRLRRRREPWMDPGPDPISANLFID